MKRKTNLPYNLKKIRMEKMLSQTELSKKIGFNSSEISQFETGRRVPSFQRLIDISIVLDCSIDSLVFGEK